MEPNELNALSALLAEDDFAKSVALGISAEKAEALNRLRALRPWRDERYSNSDIGNGYLFADFYKIPPASSASASAGSFTTARRGGRISAICRPWRNARSWPCCCFC